MEELIPIDVHCCPAKQGERHDLCSRGAVRGNRRREEVVVCLCDDRTTQRGSRIGKRRLGTTVPDLQQLQCWLEKEGITQVVMESTGSYWKPVFNVWEEAVKV